MLVVKTLVNYSGFESCELISLRLHAEQQEVAHAHNSPEKKNTESLNGSKKTMAFKNVFGAV